MTTDYYGTTSYGHDTFVTISSKRSVAEVVTSDALFLGKSVEAVHDVFDRQWFKGPWSSCGGVIFIPRRAEGDNSMAPSNDQFAMEHGMMIAEVNMAIGAIDRILKMIKDGKSNNRELTNARVELDHWRTRLLKAIHKG